VPSNKKLALIFAAAVASALAGCAAVPGSVEEQLAFDKPIGGDIYDVPPDLRMRGLIGYPRTDCCGRPGPVFIDHP
jgi:hypothetical protein